MHALKASAAAAPQVLLRYINSMSSGATRAHHIAIIQAVLEEHQVHVVGVDKFLLQADTQHR